MQHGIMNTNNSLMVFSIHHSRLQRYIPVMLYTYEVLGDPTLSLGRDYQLEHKQATRYTIKALAHLGDGKLRLLVFFCATDQYHRHRFAMRYILICIIIMRIQINIVILKVTTSLEQFHLEFIYIT